MLETEDFFAGKRPWSLIKDKVLKDYMNPYLAKVNRLGRRILLVDAYAGPGEFRDGTVGSPVIICRAAERYAQGNYQALFVNIDEQHHQTLSQVIAREGWSHSAIPLLGDTREILKVLPKTLGSQTVFLYLDPFGPTGCDFSLLEPFLKRDQRASTEIVLLMHMPIVHRLAARLQVQRGRADRQLIQSYHERLTKVFGGDYWEEMLWGGTLSAEEREWKLIDRYCAKLKQYLPYAGYCPVREKQDTRIKYFIVFVSRHPDALVLMNDCMANAYHGHMHQQNFQGTLFDEVLGWRDMRSPRSLDILRAAIKEAVAAKQGQTRKDLWTQVLLQLVPKHFMQFTEADYKQEVQKMVEAGVLVCPTPRKTKKLNDNCRLYLPN